MPTFTPLTARDRARLASLATVVLLPIALLSQAEATTIYSGQIGAVKPVMDDGKGRTGYGFDLVGRAGVAVSLPFFDMELEAQLGINTYGLSGKAITETMRAGVGMRGGVNFALYPQGFVHVSYGHQFDAVAGSPAGAIIDLGIALDVTAMPYLRLGIYGAYNHMIHTDKTKAGDGDGQWFSFGVQGSFVD